MTGGWNPVTGRDAAGGRPTFAPYGAPMPSQGQAYIPHAGGPGYNFGLSNPWGGMSGVVYPPQPMMPTSAQWPMAPMGSMGYPPQMQAGTRGYYTQHTVACQPNGVGAPYPRQPQPYPVIDPSMPAAHMTNSTGGVGCEPGYNYFFPAEHTKAHIFKTNIPPWQLPPTAQIPFKAVHIPCNTTMKDLLKGFGCTNPVEKKNKCFEITTTGNGKWYKGLEINGSDKEMMKKSIKEVGWDMTRTGHGREKPVVCLWFCKD
ncbi:hypothetical protein VHEMI10288 [[Torrubiella] hemipterigena]|uniref:Uncharacterized protein n=1 Tax=[Torrubiella] hemipterigena TaxID=1531966 RepID=A0A0A1TCM0_9HYPO|nr:hypothetical protein VHEMI10288 [[Torrubiella] hemipterigena]